MLRKVCYTAQLLKFVFASDLEFSEELRKDLRNHFAKVAHLDISLEDEFITQGENDVGHKFWKVDSGAAQSEVMHFCEDGCKKLHNLEDVMTENG